MRIKLFFGLFFVSGFSFGQCNMFCNENFDSVSLASTTSLVTASSLPCWQTTATDGMMEIWASGYNGVVSYSGIQHMEMNATMPATIFQNINATPGTTLSISFAHRGRGGVDSISVSAGPVGGPYTTLGYFGDGDSGWGYHTLNYLVPSLGTNYSIRFNCVYWAFGNPGVGNFLDAVSICNTTGIEEINNNISISIFPNPISDGALVEFENPVKDKFNMSLFDVNGRKVQSMTNITESVFKFEKKNLPSGIYLLQLSSEKNVAATKLIITD